MKRTNKNRIGVCVQVDKALYDKIIQVTEKEQRSRANMLRKLIRRGLESLHGHGKKKRGVNSK